MADRINFNNTTWKATLESVPSKSILSLKSLWDLFYDELGYLRLSSQSNSINGTSLDHDIICFFGPMYSGSSIYRAEQAISIANKTYTAEPLYEIYGIDVSLAQYDSRVKNLILDIDEKTIPKTKFNGLSSSGIKIISSNVVADSSLLNSKSLVLHDKKSALKPESNDSFITKTVFAKNTNVTEQFLRGNSAVISPPFVSTLDSLVDNNQLNADIYLTKEDIGFRGTLTIMKDFSSYNEILLNYKKNWSALLVLKALQEQLIFDPSTRLGWMDKNIEWYGLGAANNSEELINFVFGLLPSLFDNRPYNTGVITSLGADSTWKTLLQHTFVWVKASFFGDYIKPNSFEQDLTKKSDVQHKNIILSSTADYNRYDEFTTKDKDADTESLPYIPHTKPSIDFLSAKIVGVDKHLADFDESDINKIIKSGDQDTSSIGGLAFASESRDGKNDIRQPAYWDPESKLEPDTYKELNKYHLPTVIPSSGNLYASGRVISPTIDELWIYLKELTLGRRSDIYIDKNELKQRTANLQEIDEAIPYNKEDSKRQNDKDTRLVELKKAEQKFNYKIKKNNVDLISEDVYGDIVEIKTGIDDEKNQTIEVEKFVNNNEAIVYTLYSGIKRISEDVTTFDTSVNKTRQIKNFTPWRQNATNDNYYTEVVVDGEIVTTAPLWEPRLAPYSLRELEALSKGTKFNLVALARFLKENFSVVGKLGKTVNIGDTVSKKEITADNITAGAIYQFHKNYNFNIAKPNTWFNQFGTEEGDEESGACAIFDDGKLDTLTDSNYGQTNMINKYQENYSSSDVYLAADGSWRYIFDHVRLPILKVDY